VAKRKAIKFGTDGIRGAANEELTAEVSLAVGRGAAYHLSRNRRGTTGRVLVGKDTRISGDMIEAALVAGVASIGVDAWRLGIIPTPGLAYMTRSLNCDCGIMISASHNPVEDNGLKIFSGEGYKLEDEDEAAIEQYMSGRGIEKASGAEVGRFVDKSKMGANYTAHVRRRLRGVFIEGRIVVDCACGAASRFAKRVFRNCAEEVIFINSDEDGLKINVDCGSTRPDKLAARVLKHKAAFGFAFDGDADRVLFVDEKGCLVDGDQMMLMAARNMIKEKKLPGNTIVSTVMSNMGLEYELGKLGGKMIRTPVGDKFVLREMRNGGFALGGEQSGHVIFLDHGTTGDGMLTAAELLNVFSKHEGVPFSRLTRMKRSAQFLKNIRVPDRDEYYDNRIIQKKVAEVEKRLGDEGRVVVRPSGTEPLIRVMVETWDREKAEAYTDEILDTVRRELKVD